MIYVIGAKFYSPRKANRHSRQCEVAPGIKPEHMITNMLKKSNIKHSTYKNNYYLKSIEWKYIM